MAAIPATGQVTAVEKCRAGQGTDSGRTFSVDGDSRGYPVVAQSFHRVINVPVGIIYVNLQDRNMSGAIWSRIDIRDGAF